MGITQSFFQLVTRTMSRAECNKRAVNRAEEKRIDGRSWLEDKLLEDGRRTKQERKEGEREDGQLQLVS